MVSGSATFSKTLRNDYLAEANESLNVKIVTSLRQWFSLGLYDRPADGWDGATDTISLFVNGVAVVTSGSMNNIGGITDRGAGPKTYNFIASPGDVITVTGYVTYITEESFRIYSGKNLSGQMIYDSGFPTTNILSYTLPALTSSLFTNAHDYSSTFAPPSANVNVVDNSINFGSVIVTPGASTYNEGSSISYQLTDASGFSGIVYYAISSVSGAINSSDFSSPTFATALTGSLTMTSGSGTLTTTLANDLSLSGSEPNDVFNIRFSVRYPSIRIVTPPTVTTPSTATPTFSIFDGSTSNLYGTYPNTLLKNTAYNLPGLTSNNIIVRVSTAETKSLIEVWSGPNATGTLLAQIGGAVIIDTTVEIPLNTYAILSNNISINDTSYISNLGISVSPTSYNEGSTMTVNISSLSPGTTYYWSIVGTGITAADASAIAGSFTASGTTQTVNVTFTNDNSVGEGAETFVVRVRTGSASGQIVGESVTITINDTSALTERIPVNTTAAASSSSSSVVNTGFLPTYYKSRRFQTAYSAAELLACGLVAGSVIKGIKFYVVGSTQAYSNFAIGMKNTSTAMSAVSSLFEAVATVYGPKTLPAIGGSSSSQTTYTIMLDTPFTWNGTSNLLIGCAFGINTDYPSGGSGLYYTTTGAGSRAIYSDAATFTLATTTGTTLSTSTTQRPKIGLLV
jgi:hypothetical protein